MRSSRTILAALSVACGGGSSGISGTVGGQPLIVHDGMSFAGTPSCSNFAGYKSAILAVEMGDKVGLCAAAQSGAAKAGVTSLDFTVAFFSNQGQPLSIGPGSYAVGDKNSVQNGLNGILSVHATFEATDGTCHATVLQDASAGTIAISSVGATVAGSVDLSFHNGAHLAGVFNAPSCAGAALSLCSPATAQSCSP